MPSVRRDTTAHFSFCACLMPNRVHLILTPKQTDRLGDAVGEAHRRYINFINASGRWTCHLFQNRFSSVALDEANLRTEFAISVSIP